MGLPPAYAPRPQTQGRLAKSGSVSAVVDPRTPLTTAGSTACDAGLPSTAGTYDHGALELSAQPVQHHEVAWRPQRRKRHAHSVGALSWSAPRGMPASVEKRLQLDCMLAPSVTDLRINRDNLVNEAKVHGGNVVSNKIATLRPRRKPAWPEIEVKIGHHDRHLLQVIAAQQKSKRKRELPRPSQDHLLSNLNKLAFVDASDTPRDSLRLADEALMKEAASAGMPLEPNVWQGPEFRTPEDSGIFGSRLEAQVHEATRGMEVAAMMEEPRVLEVFEAFKEEAGIPRGKLVRALQALSCSLNPATEELKRMIEDIVRAMKLGGLLGQTEQHLTIQSFCYVLHAMTDIRSSYLRDRFMQLDTDASGKISVTEFRRMLWDLGFTLSMGHLEELFSEADMNSNGLLDEEEFARFASSIVENFGFSNRQVRDFEELFDRYDQDGSGVLSADELAGALGWFGTPTTPQIAQEILALCDDDSDGTLSRSEFLRVMRLRLEQEISEIRAQFAAADDDLSGLLDAAEVVKLVHKTGYTLISREVLEECIEKVRLRGDSNAVSKDSGLFFEDVLELFAALRDCEGFAEKDLQEYYAIFEQFDGSHSGHMREFELSRALYWLGYPLTAQQRRELWLIADMDKTGTLEQSEFLKIMRMVNEQETEAASVFVEKHCSLELFTDAAIADFLATLGYVAPPAVLTSALRAAMPTRRIPDLQAMQKIIKHVREAQVQKRRQCHGVADHIASKVRARFGRRAKLGKTIAPEELEKLLLEIYPAVAHSHREGEVLAILCKEGDTDGEGMNLDGAYRVISRFNDARDDDLRRREQAIADQAHFTASKVSQFRAIFVTGDTNHHGHLTAAEVLGLLDEDNFRDLPESSLASIRDAVNRLGDERKRHIEFVGFLEFLALGYSQRPGKQLAEKQRSGLGGRSRKTSRSGGSRLPSKTYQVQYNSLLCPQKEPPRLKEGSLEPSEEESEMIGPKSFGISHASWDYAAGLWGDPWPIGAQLAKVICELQKCDKDEMPAELAHDASDAIARGNYTFKQFAAWLLKNGTDSRMEERLRPLRARRRNFDINMVMGDWPWNSAVTGIDPEEEHRH